MITRVWPGWYHVDIDIYDRQRLEREQWCRDNIGFSDHDTWVFQKNNHMLPGSFSFKQEKWALMFVLRWAS